MQSSDYRITNLELSINKWIYDRFENPSPDLQESCGLVSHKGLVNYHTLGDKRYKAHTDIKQWLNVIRVTVALKNPQAKNLYLFEICSKADNDPYGIKLSKMIDEFVRCIQDTNNNFITHLPYCIWEIDKLNTQNPMKEGIYTEQTNEDIGASYAIQDGLRLDEGLYSGSMTTEKEMIFKFGIPVWFIFSNKTVGRNNP